MKNIAILGSTGSIGRNTLRVIQNLKQNGYEISVKYLLANSNSGLLIEQIKFFHPAAAVILDETKFKEVKSETSGSGCEILCGDEGLNKMVRSTDYDFAVNAMVGFSGLIPTIEAIRHGKDIALANKESLVVAGELINGLLEHSKSRLLPIDSEHSAIMQCIQGENWDDIRQMTLTASGGPFRCMKKDQMMNVTPEQALNHPNWKMGNKITIDSATLMNKGFEIIEAKWLFGMSHEQIRVLIHPQSIIHSLVEFKDGSVKAQLGVPDMKIPIQYAITYPERVESDFPRLGLEQLKNLTFDEPDFDKFECLKIAYDVFKSDGSYPVVMNAANEVAVEMFLNDQIGFLQIPELIKESLDKHDNNSELSLESILEIDSRTRNFVREFVGLKV